MCRSRISKRESDETLRERCFCLCFLKTDDEELLLLGYEWLRSAMFAEETLKIRDGVSEARKERSDAVLKRVYGNKEKGQIVDID